MPPRARLSRYDSTLRRRELGLPSDAAPAPTTVTPQPMGYTGAALPLSFRDEFEGTSLDLTKWSYGEPDQVAPNATGGYFRDDAFAPVPPPPSILSVGNSVLSMKARRDQAALDRGKQMSTCFITTRGKFDTFQHGYVEARMATPAGKSLWPALWQLGNGGYGVAGPVWPEGGEWDLIEQYNSHDISGVDTMNMIWGRNSDTVYAPSGRLVKFDHRRRGSQLSPGPTYTVRPYVLDEQFHTFTFLFTASVIEKWVDGVLIYRYVPGELGDFFKDGGTAAAEGLPQYMFDKARHLRFDLQVGGAARWVSNSADPLAVNVGGQFVRYDQGDLRIDYLRAWPLP